MKVIDLLNKIANGEELPKKIKIGDEIWTYEDVDYKASDDRGFLFEVHTRINEEDMNEEIEIIEEDKKIKHIENYVDFANLNDSEKFDYLYEMETRIINYINKEGK